MLPVIKIFPVNNPVHGSVRVPGSKSSAARALVLAALAQGTSELIDIPLNDDITILISNLRRLGVEIHRCDSVARVHGTQGKFHPISGLINFGNAGAPLRFVLTLLAHSECRNVIVDGDFRMRERPIGPLVSALCALGAKIDYLSGSGAPPLRISGAGGLRGGEIVLDVGISSQFLSSLLMVAPLCREDLTIITKGRMVSFPYVALTVEQMRMFGVTVNIHSEANQTIFEIPRDYYRVTQLTIPGDASSAGYLWSLAAATKGTVDIGNVSGLSREPDVAMIKILEQMGCSVSAGESVRVTGPNSLKNIEADLQGIPDSALSLAALGSLAQGVTRLQGLETLRHKESDRIVALQSELTKVGINSTAGKSSIEITGGQPRFAHIKSHGDHRIAMAFAVLGAARAGIEIEGPGVVNKSYPAFWRDLGALGVRSQLLTPRRIALIGFMGAGKSSVALTLRANLKTQSIELDEAIVRASGRNSVSDIFASDGEQVFRIGEARALAACCAENVDNEIILSAGGGIVERSENVALLRNAWTVVYLHASFETIEKRLRGDITRPLFQDPQKARALYERRLKLYCDAADIMVNTDELSIEEVAQAVALHWPVIGPTKPREVVEERCESVEVSGGDCL